MSTRIALLFATFALRVFADSIANPGVTGVTSTQAVIGYTAPDNSPCKVEASENPAFSPLVNDVNSTLFSGANQDNREGAVTTARNRVFAIGKRTAEIAADGKRYSRALQAFTNHYFRVTCGDTLFTGSFRTANVPLGNAYYDVPFDRSRPGDYAFPTIDFADKSKAYIDPFTGVKLTRFTGPRDIAPYTDVKTIGWAYDLAGVWRGLQAPYTGSSASTSSSNGWAYFRSADPAVWPSAQVDFIQLSFNAVGTGAAPALDVCLTIDGATCASRIVPIVIANSPATYTIGDQIPVLEFWRNHVPSLPVRRADLRKTDGVLTKTGSTVAWAGGQDLFNTRWRAGSRITVGTTDCQIAAVVNDKELTLADNACVADGPYPWSAINFGFLVRKSGKSNDSVTVSGASWILGSSATVYGSTAGAYDACQPIPVSGPTGTGFYCGADSSAMEYLGGRPLYWVGVDGTVNLLGLAINGRSYCSPLSQVWSLTVPGKFWCLGNDSDSATVVYSGIWTGVNTARKAATIATPLASTGTQWTAESTDISAAVAAFDSRYSSFVPKGAWTLVGRSKDNLILSQLEAIQNSPAWLAVWNTTTNSIVAATGTYNGGQMAANRWMVNHSVFTAGDIPAFMVHSDAGILPYQAPITSGTLGVAPWDICPPNPVDPALDGQPQCSTVTVSSTTPANPDGASLYGESWLPGDYVVIMKQDGVNWVSDREQARVLSINGNQLVLQRWPTQRQDFGGFFDHTGPLALAAIGSAWSQFWWNYEADPHGAGIPTAYGNTVMDEPQAEDCHQVYMTGIYLMGCVKFGLFNATAFKVADFPDFLSMSNSDVRFSGYFTQKFAGHSPGVAGLESHPSRQHYLASASEKQASVDNLPYYGNTKYNSFTSKVAGTTYLYRLVAPGTSQFDDKRLPLVITSSYHVLVNASPATLTDTVTDNYKYCRARAVGECWPGSAVGDIYANIPYVSEATCFSSRFSQYPETQDFCVTNASAALHRFIQFGTSRDDPSGALSRALTSGFSPYKTESIYWNSRYIPDGGSAFFVVQNLDLARAETMLVKMPPFPSEDRINRATFVPVTVNATAPAGLSVTNAVVDFGYAENGPPGSFYCTSRQETCVAASSAINEVNPFSFISDGSGGVEKGIYGLQCSSGCSLAIPSISNRVLYYQVRYRNNSNQTVWIAPMTVVAVP